MPTISHFNGFALLKQLVLSRDKQLQLVWLELDWNDIKYGHKIDMNITSSAKIIENYLETTKEAGTRTENEGPLRSLMVLSEGIQDSKVRIQLQTLTQLSIF